MFGLKNIANILGTPKDDAFAPPSALSTSDKVVSGRSENMFAKSAPGKDAKENVKVLTKVSSPSFPSQASLVVPTDISLPTLPDDESEAEEYIDIPFNDDVETEELLRRELAPARQALKDVLEELATEKVVKAEIQEELDAVQAKKDKVVNNLRNKRSLLLQVQKRNVQLEEQLACEQSKHKVATDETESLRAGLLSVSASREDLKLKLKSRQESLKQARAEQEDLEVRLAKIEGRHQTENELLTLYRKLSIHTGYFKWGKLIRVLETKLSDEAEEAAAAGNNTGNVNRSP
jgi:chromosome segregation ATPase